VTVFYGERVFFDGGEVKLLRITTPTVIHVSRIRVDADSGIGIRFVRLYEAALVAPGLGDQSTDDWWISPQYLATFSFDIELLQGASALSVECFGFFRGVSACIVVEGLS